MTDTAPPLVRYGTSKARWTIAATVLGSGMAFLDGTVVNVALPTISDDLGTSVSGLQWIVNAYLVTLSALLLLGGTLGDRYGHRSMFGTGAAIFTAASVLCGIAPTTGFLIAARTLQGVGGALLVPEPVFNADRLAGELDRLRADPDALAALSTGARSLGRRGAAAAIARLAEELASGEVDP